MATNIDNIEQYDSVTGGSSQKQMVVDFWATWCGPCRALSPTLEKMEADGLIDLVKVDVDANPELSAKYGVMSIPTMLFYKDGEENVEPLIGAYPRQGIEQHLGL